MKPLFRFLAAFVCLLLLVAGTLYHLAGKPLDYVAEVTIHDTNVEQVMQHLSDPNLVEQWADQLVELQPSQPSAQSDTDPTSELIGDNSENQAEVTIKDDQGLVKMENRFLHASDQSITVRTTSDHFDTVSIWNISEDGLQDVQVRQLQIGTRKGWSRLTCWVQPDFTQATMQKDLDRLKSFLETGQAAPADVDETGSNQPDQPSDDQPETSKSGENADENAANPSDDKPDNKSTKKSTDKKA